MFLRSRGIRVNSRSTHNVMSMFYWCPDSLNQCHVTLSRHVTLVTRVKNIRLSTFQYFFKYLQLYFEKIYFDSSRYTLIHVFSRAQSNYTCIYVEVFSELVWSCSNQFYLDLIKALKAVNCFQMHKMVPKCVKIHECTHYWILTRRHGSAR